MPLPRRRKRKAASRQAEKTPSPEPPAEAASRSSANSKKFSQRVKKKKSNEKGSKPGGQHHGTSPELSEPDPQASTPQILPEEPEVTVQPGPRAQEQQRGKSETAGPALEFLRTPFGGRLLVLDSFLYKQEKAKGDKVYWKCRQSVGLRCRGRAITRGTRATVMHGHCHPPDEEGLEARRRRQKLPIQNSGSQSSEGSDLHPGESETTAGGLASKYSAGEYKGFRGLALMSLPPKKRQMLGFGETRGLEFLRTCYGGSFLVHQSFLYKREKTVGDRVYWTCREHALQGCRSRAITHGQRVTVMRGHCHQPDEEALEARRQREKIASRLPARPVVDLLGRRGPGPLSFSRPRPRIQAKAREQPVESSSSSSDDDDEEEEEEEENPGGPEFLKTPLGGSFLVFESFLYRREKAAGNKVYWTCRDQARMGCRSRAITQGRRVTVMRGHCHPPDLGGLEALRQRQKRPNAAQQDGAGDPEFLKTPFGGTFLVFESFLYRREKVAGDKVYWTCRDQARRGCRSRAITQGLRVMVMRRHCHPPDLGGLEELRDRDNFPRLAQTEDSETFQPLEFLRTSLGGSFLVFESFLYRKEKKIGDKVYWMCREHGRRGCRSRAITQGQQVTVMRAHSHPPDLRSLEALREREKHPSPAPQDEAETNLPPDDQLCYDSSSSDELHICLDDQDTVDDTDDTAP